MSRGKRMRRLKRELKNIPINKVLITYCNLNKNYYDKLKQYLEDSSTDNKTRELADIGHLLKLVQAAEEIISIKLNRCCISKEVAETIRREANII